jgi:hypothetical protein
MRKALTILFFAMYGCSSLGKALESDRVKDSTETNTIVTTISKYATYKDRPIQTLTCESQSVLDDQLLLADEHCDYIADESVHTKHNNVIHPPNPFAPNVVLHFEIFHPDTLIVELYDWHKVKVAVIFDDFIEDGKYRLAPNYTHRFGLYKIVIDDQCWIWKLKK